MKCIPDSERYRRLVGKLIYLTITRLDISFVVGVVGQFMQNPHVDHWNAVMRILICVKKDLELNDLDRSMVLDRTLWRKLIHVADPT